MGIPEKSIMIGLYYIYYFCFFVDNQNYYRVLFTSYLQAAGVLYGPPDRDGIWQAEMLV